MKYNPKDFNEKQNSAITWSGSNIVVVCNDLEEKKLIAQSRLDYLFNKKLNGRDKILGLYFNKSISEYYYNYIIDDNLNNLYLKHNKEEVFKYILDFSIDLLRQHGCHIGLNPYFKVIESSQLSCYYIKNACLNSNDNDILDLDLSENGCWYINAQISKMIPNGGICDFDYVDKPTYEKVFKIYVEESIKYNRVHKNLLIYLILKVLNKVPELINFYRKIYKYITILGLENIQKENVKLLKLLFNDSSSLYVIVSGNGYRDMGHKSNHILNDYSENINTEILYLY